LRSVAQGLDEGLRSVAQCLDEWQTEVIAAAVSGWLVGVHGVAIGWSRSKLASHNSASTLS
jgi:hypothetical protein